MNELAARLLSVALHIVTDMQTQDEFKRAIGAADIADTYGEMLLNFSGEGQYYFDKYNIYHGKGFFDISNGLLKRIEVESLSSELFEEIKKPALDREGYPIDMPASVVGMHTVYNEKIVRIDFWPQKGIICLSLGK